MQTGSICEGPGLLLPGHVKTNQSVFPSGPPDAAGQEAVDPGQDGGNGIASRLPIQYKMISNDCGIRSTGDIPVVKQLSAAVVTKAG